MGIEDSHPALGFARELFGEDGWEITDSLGRDGDAVVVDLRRQGIRHLFIAVARDGVWEKPGLVTVVAKEVPEQRRATTLPGSALEPVSMGASGWPGSDGGPPDTVWLTVNGFAAADVEAVELLTDLDRHEARVLSDGSFLTLVRARRREEPRLRLHLTTGETRDESL